MKRFPKNQNGKGGHADFAPHVQKPLDEMRPGVSNIPLLQMDRLPLLAQDPRMALSSPATALPHSEIL